MLGEILLGGRQLRHQRFLKPTPVRPEGGEMCPTRRGEREPWRPPVAYVDMPFDKATLLQ